MTNSNADIEELLADLKRLAELEEELALLREEQRAAEQDS